MRLLSIVYTLFLVTLLGASIMGLCMVLFIASRLH